MAVGLCSSYVDYSSVLLPNNASDATQKSVQTRISTLAQGEFLNRNKAKKRE